MEGRRSATGTFGEQAQRAPSRLDRRRGRRPGQRRIRLARREAAAARELLDLPARLQRLGRGPDLLQRPLAEVAERAIVDVAWIEVALGRDERGAAQRLADDPGRLAALVELEVDQERELHRVDEVLRPAAPPDVAADELAAGR